MEQEKNTILREWLKTARKENHGLLLGRRLTLEDFNIGFPIDAEAKDTKGIEVDITISNKAIDNDAFDVGQHLGEKLYLAGRQFMRKHNASVLVFSPLAYIHAEPSKTQDGATSIKFILKVAYV